MRKRYRLIQVHKSLGGSTAFVERGQLTPLQDGVDETDVLTESTKSSQNACQMMFFVEAHLFHTLWSESSFLAS